MHERRAAGQIDLDRRAAAGTGLEFGERQRREREIGADQLGRRQHRQRIEHEMAARRADLVGELGAEDLRLDRRAVGVQRAFEQARVGLFVLAERHDARDAGFLGAALELRELRNVAIEDGGAAGSRPRKISALASAILASEPKNSRCTGAIVVMIATCGRTSRDSGSISPA